MEEETKFETYGFDTFIGRVICQKVPKTIISLDMKSFGSFKGTTLEEALRFLCIDIRGGKKVLLSKSPGRIGLREVCLEDVGDLVKKLASGNENYPIRKRWEVLEPESYEVLEPEELRQLEAMYEKRIDMKLYPNPFLYQPR